MNPAFSREKAGIFLIMLVGMGARIVAINQPFVDEWMWRQSDTAMIAENFYHGGFRILFPQINWAGSSPGWVGTEFPLVSFLAALLFIPFGIHEWVGRMVSVMFFTSSVPVYYFLVKEVSSRRAAFFAVGIYTLAPLSVYAGRTFMPDMASLFFSILTMYLFLRYLREPHGVWFLTSAGLSCCLAILTKGTAAVIGLPLLYLAWKHHGFKLFRRSELWLFGSCCIFVPAAWYLHAYKISVQNPPYHMFGEGILHITSLETYLSILRATAFTSLTMIVTIVMIVGIFLAPRNQHGRLFHFWLIGSAAFLIFAGEGHRQHEWYRLPIVPIVATFGAFAMSAVMSGLETVAGRKTAIASCVLFFLLLTYQSQKALRSKYEARGAYLHALGSELDHIASRDALVAVADLGDPTAIYYSKRKGWHFLRYLGRAPQGSAEAIIEVDKLREEGARYFAFTKKTKKWLKQFPDFKMHLDSRYVCVKETSGYLIYDVN